MSNEYMNYKVRSGMWFSARAGNRSWDIGYVLGVNILINSKKLNVVFYFCFAFKLNNVKKKVQSEIDIRYLFNYLRKIS